LREGAHLAVPKPREAGSTRGALGRWGGGGRCRLGAWSRWPCAA
jgi:hypothetical protein